MRKGKSVTKEPFAEAAAELGRSKNQLAADFRSLVHDAEGLLSAAAGFSGEGVAAVRAKLSARLDDIKENFSDAGVYVGERYREAVHKTDRYVHARPWQAVGIAAAAGLVIGFLCGRRSE